MVCDFLQFRVNQQVGLMQPQGLQEKIPDLRRQLQKLWSLHDEHNKKMNTWVVTTREDCEERLATARSLWRKSESLVYATAEGDEDCDTVVLLGECKNLLASCDDLVASAEEILRLYDLGTDTSVMNCISDESADSESALEAYSYQ
jgi:hypothetical protein